ncbi:UNVERIFIED_CONTAM: UDP-glucuronate 4-epimerase 3 [Sesamum angustifolium]|uniref:UDP-glucuronate 4-epimerase n=1 Tax=Sesamum angustifolium TaxID=2727405 RepID=A0AAW2MKP6_9LAMI
METNVLKQFIGLLTPSSLLHRKVQVLGVCRPPPAFSPETHFLVFSLRLFPASFLLLLPSGRLHRRETPQPAEYRLFGPSASRPELGGQGTELGPTPVEVGVHGSGHGAAGFVGTHVAMALKNRGDGVVGLDNFNNYYETGLKKARKSLLERRGVYIIEGDINDAALLGKLFEIVHFTHVMHLAAQAGVRYAMQNPNSYIHSNVNGFVSLLEACKNANPQPSIVWASSSSVYGLNSKVPFSEKDRTDQPASLYAATKKAGEEIAHTYNHIYGLSITGLRFFTVYGPWGRPDMAYYFFTKDILRGKEIKIFEGADHATVARDFTYIDDVVEGCLAALDTAKKSTGSGGKKKGAAQLRIYNLGNTSPVPVGKLVSILEKLLKIKAKKKFLPMPRNGDVLFTHANISLARKELGYKPTTDLETGLKKFVKWYLSYYGAKKKSTW